MHSYHDHVRKSDYLASVFLPTLTFRSENPGLSTFFIWLFKLGIVQFIIVLTSSSLLVETKTSVLVAQFSFPILEEHGRLSYILPSCQKRLAALKFAVFISSVELLTDPSFFISSIDVLTFRAPSIALHALLSLIAVFLIMSESLSKYRLLSCFVICSVIHLLYNFSVLLLYGSQIPFVG